MCTLTILREPHRVLVTMNRDDASKREESLPALAPHAETAFAAPRDLQAGGTWIGMNHHGVIACLLNRYDVAPQGRASRGAIVIAAMRGSSGSEASTLVTALDHCAYSPFTCLVITEHGATRLDWTGLRLERAELPQSDDITMLTSSSWQFDEVRARRETLLREIWEERDAPVARIRAFHSQRIEDNDAWAPMMQRPNSETKSVTQVDLMSSSVQMHCWTRETAIARRLTSPEATFRFDRVKR